MFAQYSFEQLANYIAQLYQGRRVDIRPFGYVFDFDDLTVGQQSIKSQKIIGNANFMVCSMAFNLPDSNEFSVGSLIQVEDSGSMERFFDSPAPINIACSLQATRARGLPIPRLVAGNSILTATLTAASTLTDGQLYLDGVSVYVYSN